LEERSGAYFAGPFPEKCTKLAHNATLDQRRGEAHHMDQFGKEAARCRFLFLSP
jgi:hypothetical protein